MLYPGELLSQHTRRDTQQVFWDRGHSFRNLNLKIGRK